MKNRWQKSLIAAVAVLSLGAISPNHSIWESLLEEKHQHNTHASQDEDKNYIYDWQDTSEFYITTPSRVDRMLQTAEEQAYLKFGSRIGPVIEDQFQQLILPKMLEALDLHLTNAEPGQLDQLAISERPSGDYSEKIFHIYNTETNTDEIRFHVRTEKKPKEGYFFNFHYHVATDNFQQHITIGDIYWSKNTPPKWLS
ncbi:MAG TPA: YpjP family protein [Planococcus sp. (in: firmicutes)]|nr:YpjP family protein [Planococcus sp. (in: firmicutes)]